MKFYSAGFINDYRRHASEMERSVGLATQGSQNKRKLIHNHMDLEIKKASAKPLSEVTCFWNNNWTLGRMEKTQWETVGCEYGEGQ